MKILIESTPVITTVNGRPARVWKGLSESGIECTLYVTMVSVDRDADTSAFARELDEQLTPQELRTLPLPQTLNSRMF